MSWKTVQKRNKIKKTTRIALISLALLLIMLLLSQAIRFTKILMRPYSLMNTSKNYTWDGEFNLNFVVLGKSISLISYSPDKKQVTVINIPDETYIDVAGGFGKWQLRSVYELGKSSNISGEYLLKKSLSDFLGIPIDGFSSDNLVDVFRQNLLSGITLLPELKTDLTVWELIQLKVASMGLRFDKIKKIDIADPVRLDTIVADLKDPKIQAEHLSIAVFNATNKPLLAQKAKRLIENSGGNVIVTQNAPKSVEKSYVEGEKSKTLERLAQIFDLGCQSTSQRMKCDRIPVDELGIAASRAQIIVVLGQDF